MLFGAGQPTVANDQVVLSANHVPIGVTTLFFEGTTPVAPMPFGDGLLCVVGSIKRLAIKPATGGVVAFPEAGDPAISTAGSLTTAGGTRAYQLWYRDPANFCGGQFFNTSNAVQIDWVP